MYLTQHVQVMCAIAAVGLTLTGIGMKYALQIVSSQAVTNEHLDTLNGSVARHEDLIAANTSSIAETIERIDASRQRQEDRARAELAEFRVAVQKDIQTALDRWNTKHHQEHGDAA